jgi:hypothetical protein
VRQILPQHMPQRVLPEQDELLQTFGLDRLHKALGKRIQVRGVRRQNPAAWISFNAA